MGHPHHNKSWGGHHDGNWCPGDEPDFFGMFMSGRGRHQRGPGGPGGGNPGGFGPFGPGFPWSFFGRGAPRAKRGDVRAAILALLSEQPRNGYQIIQELEQRSHGAWRPSPGSIYPSLQQLEDEGLIRAEASGTGRVFALTEAGRQYVKEHPDEVSAPWESVSEQAGVGDLADLAVMLRRVVVAFKQVSQVGSPAQVTEAKRVLAEATRSLYRILAQEEPYDE